MFQDHRGGIPLGGTKLAPAQPGTPGVLGAGLIVLAAPMRRKLFGS